MTDHKVCFPAIIKFSAKFCGPCHQIVPLVKELSSKYPKIKVYTFDLDKDKDTVEQLEDTLDLNIKSIPLMILVGDNEKIIEKVTGTDKKGIINLFEKADRLLRDE